MGNPHQQRLECRAPILIRQTNLFKKQIPRWHEKSVRILGISISCIATGFSHTETSFRRKGSAGRFFSVFHFIIEAGIFLLQKIVHKPIELGMIFFVRYVNF